MTATLTPAPPRTAGHPGRWHALAVSQIAAFMALLDVSIVNVALPSIQRDPNAAPPWPHRLTAGVVLAVAASGLVLGLGSNERRRSHALRHA